jgi:phosphoglycolate phosphatase
MEVVFDLDGTLIDSVRDLSAAASELATSLGGRPLEQDEVATMIGDGASVLVKRALAASGVDPETPDAMPRFLRIYDRRLLETTVPYRGVPEMLSMASRRARLTVLTNKPIGPSMRILDALGLSPFFEAVIGGDGPEGRKPDPAGLRALSRGATAVLMVGDSPIDWQTAQAADCSLAWARYGFGAVRFNGYPPQTPYVLDAPADLAGVLDRFAALAEGT